MTINSSNSTATVTFRPLLPNGTVDPLSEPITFPVHSFVLDGRQLIPTATETLMTPTPVPARPTKAALIRLAAERDDAVRALAQRERALALAEAEAAAWKAVKVADPEAEALSGCVRAIEALLSSAQVNVASYAMGFSRPPPPQAAETPIGRILLHLSARYGVPLAPPAPPAPDPDEAVMITVPRRVAEQIAKDTYRG